MWGCPQFAYEMTRSLWTSPRTAKPRPASPNCLVRSALVWDSMQPRVVNSLPMFQDKGQKIKKREHSMSEVNWHSLLFWYCVHPVFKEGRRFRSQLQFHFQAKNLVDHLDWLILNHWTPQKHVLKYVPENRSSRRLKNKSWTNPQIENHTKSHELSLIWPRTCGSKWHGSTSHQKWLWRILSSAVYPVQWDWWSVVEWQWC